MTIVEQAARYIAAKLRTPFEGTEDGSVFWGYLPETPTKAICVYADDLRCPGDDEGTKLQVIIRSDLDGGWALEKAIAIMSILDDMRDLIFVQDGAYITRISAEKGFEFNGMSNNAQFYSANFQVYYCAG